MYCVVETQFYCDGDGEQAAARFNALLGDLKGLLKKHPGVTCPALDEDDWRIEPADLQEHAETEAERDALAEGRDE